MTEAPPNKPAKLTDIEKSAVVMMSIGQDTAAEVMKLLSQPEIDRLSAAMAQISNVSKTTVAAALQEFVDLVAEGGSFGIGSQEYVRGVLEKALGREKADRLVGRLKQGNAVGIEAVKWQEPRALAEMVKAEHPQIVAMVLAHLEPEQAQGLIQYLPDELVERVIPRLATLDAIPPTVVRELSDSIEHLLAAEPQQAPIMVGGVEVAAKILNRVGTERAERVLGTIKDVDPELAQALTDNMFVFEDLFAVDDRSLQILLRSVDQKLLVVALKGVASAALEKVLRNLSQRAGEMLREEIESRGPMRLAEIEAARKEIVTAAQTLGQEGKIILRNDPGDLVS
jgi:flagellar motor switch protein FliG